MSQGEGKIIEMSQGELLCQLFWTFLKIGAFTIGGGYVMLPLMEQAIVKERKWLKYEEYLDMITISQSAPGVIAINSAVTVGYQIAGLKGAIMATLGAALPSFLIIIGVASVLVNIRHNPYVEAFFHGVRPAVVVLMFMAAFTMGRKTVKNKVSFGIFVAGLIGVALLHIHPIFAIIAAGIFGSIYFHYN